MIFAILGFLFSIPGLIVMLLGMLLFLCLPLISMVSSFKGFARVYLNLATFPLRRAAVVISQHNDALFRQMTFSGLGYETIVIDDETKAFEDPDSALHYWNGIKFALADEEHGVLFDPRHAAIGMRKRLKDDHDEGEFLATTSEWEQFGVAKWLPGVFEMPRLHEIVDLSAVQELIDGGERSEFAERVEELYKHSRDPFDDGTPPMKFLYPIISFAVPFFGCWLMASQFGLGGGGSSSTVSFGTLLALLAGLSNPFTGVDWRRAAGLSLLLGTPLLVVAGLVVLVGPGLTAAIVVALLVGMALLPLLTMISKPSAILSGALCKLYFRLGFLGYRRPVLEWTPAKYRLREYDELDSTDHVEWYNLFGTIVGFTYEPRPESWGAEPISNTELEAQQPLTDGGEKEDTDTNLPAKYTRSTELSRDTYGGYIPKRLSDKFYYIRSGIAMNRFTNVATGQKSLQKLLQAKDEHGGGSKAIDDGTVFKASIVFGILGTIGGVGLFVLPAFL